MSLAAKLADKCKENTNFRPVGGRGLGRWLSNRRRGLQDRNIQPRSYSSTCNVLAKSKSVSGPVSLGRRKRRQNAGENLVPDYPFLRRTSECANCLVTPSSFRKRREPFGGGLKGKHSTHLFHYLCVWKRAAQRLPLREYSPRPREPVWSAF